MNENKKAMFTRNHIKFITTLSLAFLLIPQETYSMDKANDAAQEIDPLVEKFVKDQLFKCGLKDQESLRLRRSKRWSAEFEQDYFLKRSDVILIGEHDTLKYCLTRKSLFKNYQEERLVRDKDGKIITRSIDEYLKQSAAIVHHEGGHILNGDCRSRILDIEDPTKNAWYYGSACSVLLSPFAFLCKSKIVSLPLFIGAALIVPTYSCLGQKSVCRYSHYRELRADDAIQDNIHLLAAFKQHLKDHWLLNDEYYQENKANSHPHPRIRIGRLKKRIKALKEKGDPKAFEDPLAFKESEIK